jgi:hypothetical protein
MEEVGLERNAEKAKYVVVSHYQNERKNHDINGKQSF